MNLKPSERARLEEVRRIGSDRSKEAAATLTKAFRGDPLFAWLFGKEPPEDKLEIWWHWIIQNSTSFTEMYAMGDLSGVSMWSPSTELLAQLLKKTDLDPASEMKLIEVYDEKFMELSYELFGAKKVQIFEELYDLVPGGEWWYLSCIGVDPSFWNRGRGGKLLEAMLKYLDSASLPAYLEATAQKNKALYERYGFSVTGEFQFKDSPVIYLMWREPR